MQPPLEAAHGEAEARSMRRQIKGQCFFSLGRLLLSSQQFWKILWFVGRLTVDENDSKVFPAVRVF